MLDHKLAAKAAAARAYKTDSKGNTIVTFDTMELKGDIRFNRYEDLPRFSELDLAMAVWKMDNLTAGG